MLNLWQKLTSSTIVKALCSSATSQIFDKGPILPSIEYTDSHITILGRSLGYSFINWWRWSTSLLRKIFFSQPALFIPNCYIRTMYLEKKHFSYLKSMTHGSIDPKKVPFRVEFWPPYLLSPHLLHNQRRRGGLLPSDEDRLTPSLTPHENGSCRKCYEYHQLLPRTRKI